MGDWKTERSERGPDLSLFKVRFDWVVNPRNGREMKAVVLETPDWVNVAALTPQGKLLVVRQYRLGVGRATVEIPAGIVEPGERPIDAAKRELVEETGYTSADWQYLGWVDANPAFMDNSCHLWLARDVTLTQKTDLDAGEDVTVDELSFAQVQEEIRAGRMRNVFTLAALGLVFDLRADGGDLGASA